MGLFGFVKNNTLKSIEWLDNTKDTIIYRFPMDGRSIMWGSKLTVRESQIAIFVNKGKIADVFEPGIHTLKTSNLPILTQILSLPFGFKSPFYSEVYFINMKQFTNQKWGTSNPITMRDKEFGTIRIRAYGKFAYRVQDANLFLKELFGTNSTFTTEDIVEYFRSILVANISDTIAESKISALDLSCNLLEFNEVAKQRLKTTFETLGLSLTNLVIENISFPEEVEKAIDTRSSLGVIGDKMDSFVKFQTANAIKDAAKNESGNIATAGVGLGAGVAMGNLMQEALKTKNEDKPEEKGKFCSNCGAKVTGRHKFCPECGNKIAVAKVCPECGEPIDGNKKFCGNCGAKLK